MFASIVVTRIVSQTIAQQTSNVRRHVQLSTWLAYAVRHLNSKYPLIAVIYEPAIRFPTSHTHHRIKAIMHRGSNIKHGRRLP